MNYSLNMQNLIKLIKYHKQTITLLQSITTNLVPNAKIF